MAASAASRAAGQPSDCQAGAEGGWAEVPATVEELSPEELPLACLEEAPTPDAAGPVVLGRGELVPEVRGLELLGEVCDWPEPAPVPLEFVGLESLPGPGLELEVISVAAPAPGSGAS